LFLTVLKSEAGNADQLSIAKRAKHSGTAESIREPAQRLRIFKVKSTTERFGVSLECLQPNVSISADIACVLVCKTTYLHCAIHLSAPMLDVPQQGIGLNRAILDTSHNRYLCDGRR
jgi:hypothetical protein